LDSNVDMAKDGAVKMVTILKQPGAIQRKNTGQRIKIRRVFKLQFNEC
jgi:hypothetical protein